MNERRPLELLIIQPTPFCNLDCDYCYLPGRQLRNRISPEVLRMAFRRAFESPFVGAKFTVVWHAGEPLVLPISFYEMALALLSEENHASVKVGHSFQTNATLITEDWCAFFKRNGLSIGVSVDGPDFLHDRHRKTRSGSGTWDKVSKGIKMLNEQALPFHVISVLTADSLDFPDELYDFYMSHGIHQLSFNIEEIEGPHTESSMDGIVPRRRLKRFLDRFFDLVSDGNHRMSVREFDFAYAAIARGASLPQGTAQQTTPFGIVSVDCFGNFSTFSPELLGLEDKKYGGFGFGNVMTDSLESALASERFKKVARDVAAGVEQCRNSCEYFNYCGGGAPVNKYFENGGFDSTETMFCRLSIQEPMDVVLDKLLAKRRAPNHQQVKSPCS